MSNSIYIPALALVALIQSIISIEYSDEYAIDELEYALFSLSKFNCNTEISILTKEKVYVFIVLHYDSIILMKTRLSGDSTPAQLGYVMIFDFDYILRISSHAYASVFLIQKKNIGDIFAIKAFSKTLVN